MFIERPPLAYRLLYRGAVWRATRFDSRGNPLVYLTFDDGPTPEATPGVLDILGRHDIRAVFFMVADNARRYPDLLEQVRVGGHIVANHTTHHLQGLYVSRRRYLEDIDRAEAILGPSRFFRPPHGLLRPGQYRAVGQRFRIIMHDVVSRDYSARLSPGQVVRNVTSKVRPGSVIVFHDSEKSALNVLSALEPAIVALRDAGYKFALLK